MCTRRKNWSLVSKVGKLFFSAVLDLGPMLLTHACIYSQWPNPWFTWWCHAGTWINLHIACKRCTITVTNKSYIPVIEVRVGRWIVGQKPIQFYHWRPILGWAQTGLAPSNTVILVVAPSSSLHVHNPVFCTISWAWMKCIVDCRTRRNLTAIYQVGSSSRVLFHPNKQLPKEKNNIYATSTRNNFAPDLRMGRFSFNSLASSIFFCTPDCKLRS